MGITLTVHATDRKELAELEEWLGGIGGVKVQSVSAPGASNTQGLWEFLSVACGAGGPAVGLVQALKVWIESRATTIRVTVGDSEFVVRSIDAATVLPIVARAIETLPSSEAKPPAESGGNPAI
ncbi:effector-associated constant component EACC1 [Catenulispora pinisilvae]|uniref:effector-associated constant component EACC1 n=1 Tax=Catenulispora pinisilvae TaxID=2705253 RepID=UPI0018913B0A|nr:hypothetical protein [Catenulispora pinisilvae]